MDQTCSVCGNVGFNDGGDGYFYCGSCNTQADDLINMCLDEDDLDAGVYSQRHARQTPVIPSQTDYHVRLSHSQQFGLPNMSDDDNDVHKGDGVGPSGPRDFGSCPRNLSYEDYYMTIRSRYVMGFQIMMQIQCKALVENLNVSPLIVGLQSPIWLRYLAYTRVMADEWADQVLHHSEIQHQGDVVESQRSSKNSAEPQNMLGKRAVMIWLKSLHLCLPLSYTLAMNFLICHVANEPILPTDMIKWTLEGKIPYFSAYVDVEKQLGPPPPACPISSRIMFRPAQVISPQKLESTAAHIAEKIGLELPPLDFNAIATRYIQELDLPVSQILPIASRIYEWSMPRGLYLSKNENLPSCVCVMSILIVALRIRYDINGYGKWEATMSSPDSPLSSAKLDGRRKSTFGVDGESDAPEDYFVPDQSSKDDVNGSDAVDLLQILEGKYSRLKKLHDTFEHSKDLLSYLRYCKDSVFAGLEPSFDYYEEENLIEDFWGFYQQQKADDDSEEHCNLQFSVGKNDSSQRVADMERESQPQGSCYRDGALRCMKRDMEENRFVYIPPRIKAKSTGHIHYSRKQRKGAYVFAVHCDYYILLRSCATAARVDARTMHQRVLAFERSLKQREREQAIAQI